MMGMFSPRSTDHRRHRHPDHRRRPPGPEPPGLATTAYLITSTIVTPLYGKLGDIYGRKKLFIIAISVFIIGSVLCTFATSMGSLAFSRGAGPGRRWPVLVGAGHHR
jgi:MFS family permease